VAAYPSHHNKVDRRLQAIILYLNLRQLQLTGGIGVLVNMSKDSGFSLSISLGSFLGSYTPVAYYELL
jgi:hypothetical protein